MPGWNGYFPKAMIGQASCLQNHPGALGRKCIYETVGRTLYTWLRYHS